jgi:hypothetical protein
MVRRNGDRISRELLAGLGDDLQPRRVFCGDPFTGFEASVPMNTAKEIPTAGQPIMREGRDVDRARKAGGLPCR